MLVINNNINYNSYEIGKPVKCKYYNLIQIHFWFINLVTGNFNYCSPNN